VDAIGVHEADRAPLVLEEAQVRERFAEGKAQLMAVELAPEEHGHQLGRATSLHKRIKGLAQTRRVMVAQLAEPRVQTAER